MLIKVRDTGATDPPQFTPQPTTKIAVGTAPAV